MPRTDRPPLTWSRLVASLAVSPGLRNVLAATSSPSRTRVVRTAVAARDVQPSSFGSRQSPSSASRWSSSQTSSNPAASAWRTASRSSGQPVRWIQYAAPNRIAIDEPPRPYRRGVATPPDPDALVPPALRDAILAWYDAGRARPRLPCDPRPVCRPRVGADGPADAGRAGGGGVDALDGALPDGRRPRRGAGRRRRAGVGGPRVQPAGGQPPPGREGGHGRSRRPRPGHGRGAADAAGRRAVHGAGGGGDRVRAAGRGGRHERAPGPRAGGGRRGRGVQRRASCRSSPTRSSRRIGRGTGPTR